MFYAIPTLEPAYLSQGEKDLTQASADTFRNAAVAKRDEGLRFRKEGKPEEAENALPKNYPFERLDQASIPQQSLVWQEGLPLYPALLAAYFHPRGELALLYL